MSFLELDIVEPEIVENDPYGECVLFGIPIRRGEGIGVINVLQQKQKPYRVIPSSEISKLLEEKAEPKTSSPPMDKDGTPKQFLGYVSSEFQKQIEFTIKKNGGVGVFEIEIQTTTHSEDPDFRGHLRMVCPDRFNPVPITADSSSSTEFGVLTVME